MEGSEQKMDDQPQGQPPGQNQSPPPASDPKSQIVDRLKQANNVLVTVSNNPTVDQLAACIGLTLILNKMEKHATAVFSGQTPSTLDFLKPEETLEKNTDSLRDFIISLDKSKADKLRYKVEDKVVKIFITPYRTSISDQDLEFSQGDFNVDVVVALGVRQQQDLDQAITAHGRILHDATVTTIGTTTTSELGSINWQDSNASSLSELITNLSDSFGQNLLDEQIATALLTGIVAETNRFSNDKTTPRTMSASAALMMAGANQQLVATKLEPPEPPTAPPASPPQPPAGPTRPTGGGSSQSGTLDVDHGNDNRIATTPEELEKLTAEEQAKEEQIHIDNDGVLHRLTENAANKPLDQLSAMDVPAALPGSPVNSRLIIEPPTLGGTLTANSRPEELQPEGLKSTVDGLSLPQPQTQRPIMSHSKSTITQPPMPSTDTQDEQLVQAPTPTLSQSVPKTLSQIEQKYNSPHLDQVDTPNISHESTERQVEDTLDINSLSNAAKEAAESSEPLPKPEAFGSQYAANNLNTPPGPPQVPPAPHPAAQVIEPWTGVVETAQTPGFSPSDQPMTMPLPPNNFMINTPPPANQTPPSNSSDQPPAPPVPPPLFPPAG